MANRIKIRHGSSAPSTSNLLSYELGWDGTNLALYINNNGTIKKVGGEGAFLPLTGGAMTGTLKLASSSGVYNEGSPLFYWLAGSASNYQKMAGIFADPATVNSKKVCNRLYLREYSYSSSTGASLEAWDQYYLPSVAADKTTSNSYEILTSNNYTDYTVTKTGTGASGSWGISITGTAAVVGKGSHPAVVNVNEFSLSSGTLTVVGNVSNTTMPHANNANAEIVIKAHQTVETNYYEARLGFSSDKALYYMPVNTSTWKTIAYTDSNITGNAATATSATQDGSGNVITTSYLRRYPWWESSDSHNADDLHGGTTFAYAGHTNVIATGTLVSFDSFAHDNYGLQLQGSYGNNFLYFRNRDGDHSAWGSWRGVVYSDLPRRIWVTTSSSYSSSYYTGDIVLVKA